jgi:hypothetical protein
LHQTVTFVGMPRAGSWLRWFSCAAFDRAAVARSVESAHKTAKRAMTKLLIARMRTGYAKVAPGPDCPRCRVEALDIRDVDQRRQSRMLSALPRRMAPSNAAWSRSFWSAYRRANLRIALVNTSPFPM